MCVKLHTVFEITQCAQNYIYSIGKIPLSWKILHSRRWQRWRLISAVNWQSRMFLCQSKYFQEHHSSLAARQKDLKKFVTPAPGMYEVRSSSAFWFWKNIASNFQAVDMTQYKSKSPVFSLGQRFNPPADRFFTKSPL